MVKYKNKNLKITLSLVVSTMSIIMANCMDGQGSGSSSSNAPAASGSSSSNTCMSHVLQRHVLEFLNNQNGIEASQSALQNTQSALAGRVNTLELTGRVNALELTIIQNNQNGIEANQSALQNTQSALQNTQSALQNTQSALVGRVNGLELTIIRNQRHLTNQIDAEHVITSIEIADVRKELADVIADVRREFSDSDRHLSDVLKILQVQNNCIRDESRGLSDANIRLLDNHREHADSKIHAQNMDIEFLRSVIQGQNMDIERETDRLRDEIHEATEAGYKYINSRTPNTCYGCFTGLFDLLLRFINARRSLDGRFDAVQESLDRMRSYAKEDRNELIERISELEAIIEELRGRDNTRSNPNKRTNRAYLRIRSRMKGNRR